MLATSSGDEEGLNFLAFQKKSQTTQSLLQNVLSVSVLTTVDPVVVVLLRSSSSSYGVLAQNSRLVLSGNGNHRYKKPRRRSGSSAVWETNVLPVVPVVLGISPPDDPDPEVGVVGTGVIGVGAVGVVVADRDNSMLMTMNKMAIWIQKPQSPKKDRGARGGGRLGYRYR